MILETFERSLGVMHLVLFCFAHFGSLLGPLGSQIYGVDMDEIG